MSNAKVENQSVYSKISIPDENINYSFVCKNQKVVFDGFLKVYEEGRDDSVGDGDKRLPQVMQGEAATKKTVSPDQHFTQPPH